MPVSNASYYPLVNTPVYTCQDAARAELQAQAQAQRRSCAGQYFPVVNTPVTACQDVTRAELHSAQTLRKSCAGTPILMAHHGSIPQSPLAAKRTTEACPCSDSKYVSGSEINHKTSLPNHKSTVVPTLDTNGEGSVVVSPAWNQVGPSDKRVCVAGDNLPPVTPEAVKAWYEKIGAKANAIVPTIEDKPQNFHTVLVKVEVEDGKKMCTMGTFTEE
jgi:hypothetical protein